MKDKKDTQMDIGTFFNSRLDNISIKEDESLWLKMQPTLKRAKFLSFGLYNFNIYYASIIFITFAFSSAQFIKNSFFNEDKVTIQKIIITENTSALKTDSTEVKQAEFKKILPDKIKSVKPVINDDTEKKPEDVKSSTKDSLPKIKQELKEDVIIKEQYKTEKLPVPEKKVVYIKKRDTIVVVDSVEVGNKKNKAKKKK